MFLLGCGINTQEKTLKTDSPVTTKPIFVSECLLRSTELTQNDLVLEELKQCDILTDRTAVQILEHNEKF